MTTPTPVKEKKEAELDDILSGVDLSEKTEMGEVANNVFKKGAGRTNLTEDQVTLVLINDLMFKGLGLDELNPAETFMELKKSLDGWSTQKFVEAVGGMNNQRSGGTFGAVLGNAFKPRNGNQP